MSANEWQAERDPCEAAMSARQTVALWLCILGAVVLSADVGLRVGFSKGLEAAASSPCDEPGWEMPR